MTTIEHAPAPRGLEGLDLAAIAAVAGCLAFGAYVALAGPTGPIPMHMGVDGTVDRWGDRREAGVLLGVIGVISGLAYLLVAWIVRRKPLTVAARRGLWFAQLILVLMIVMLAALFGAIIFGRFQPGDDATPIARLVGAFLSGILLVTGALVGKTTPNPLIGVRVYWTLTSRLAWDKANRLLGRLWVAIGLISLPANLLAPQPIGVIVTIGALIAAAVVAIIESWRVWLADPDRRTA